ncbi:hypothetical protein ACFYT3_20760 [Nocardia amikacinitolerans]|uniref:hypothetical protein n=1 Tax=Nocardia amikacinitolerans TaxID=756689 RepID=UPI0020A3A16E|nr:hypothetical protein [Nocardia amikacinitolerans]MCP2289877.1 hypothetical protein [Nocardia amikacinitolerans]
MSLGDAFGLTNSPNFLPKHHGDEGDTRYPSPRKLRSLGATLIDFVLQFGSIVAMAVLLVVEVPGTFRYSVLLIPVVVVGGNRILLPKWVHASVGELIFGLVEIRGSDGAWPGWRDLWRGHGAGRDGLPNLVNVRRCDV